MRRRSLRAIRRDTDSTRGTRSKRPSFPNTTRSLVTRLSVRDRWIDVEGNERAATRRSGRLAPRPVDWGSPKEGQERRLGMAVARATGEVGEECCNTGLSQRTARQSGAQERGAAERRRLTQRCLDWGSAQVDRTMEGGGQHSLVDRSSTWRPTRPGLCAARRRRRTTRTRRPLPHCNRRRSDYQECRRHESCSHCSSACASSPRPASTRVPLLA